MRRRDAADYAASRRFTVWKAAQQGDLEARAVMDVGTEHRWHCSACDVLHTERHRKRVARGGLLRSTREQCAVELAEARVNLERARATKVSRCLVDVAIALPT